MGLGASSFQDLSVDQGIRAISEFLWARNWSSKDAFSWLDRDHNGWVSWEEFLEAVNYCCSLNQVNPAHPESLTAIFRKFDADSNGFISLEEFDAVINRDAQLDKIATEVLERIASALVRTQYSPQQLFQNLDKDRNGVLTRIELEEVILGLQPDLTPTEREAIFKKLDKNESGSVDIAEFYNAVQAVHAEPLVALEEKIRHLQRTFTENGYGQFESFQVYDQNGDGYLSREEWVAAMATLLPDMNPQDSEAIFMRFDANGDGFLSIQEFSMFFQDFSDRVYQHTPGQLPQYVPPPVEAEWEKEVLDLVRDCFSYARTGISITEVFRRLDVDHDSKMTAYEFNRMVTTYRPDLTSEHLAALFQKVNTSQSGCISMSEFVARFG